MAPGDARTRKMELIVTKMRTLGLAAYPYLGEFSRSTSAGERLAAIAILQINPHSQYGNGLRDQPSAKGPLLRVPPAAALLLEARASRPPDRTSLNTTS